MLKLLWAILSIPICPSFFICATAFGKCSGGLLRSLSSDTALLAICGNKWHFSRGKIQARATAPAVSFVATQREHSKCTSWQHLSEQKTVKKRKNMLTIFPARWCHKWFLLFVSLAFMNRGGFLRFCFCRNCSQSVEWHQTGHAFKKCI